MCQFCSGTFECRGDGYLWDADDDGFDLNDLSSPCPCCNTLTFLADAKNEAESISSYRSMMDQGSGVDIWEYAITLAKRWNQDNIQEELSKIKTVAALYEDANGEVLEKTFTYN